MSSKIVFIGCDGDNKLHLGLDGNGFNKKILPKDFETYEFKGKSAMLTGGKDACYHEMTVEDLKELFGELKPGQMVVCEVKPLTTIDLQNPSEIEYLKTIPEDMLIKED
jgi:hypothetical protein